MAKVRYIKDTAYNKTGDVKTIAPAMAETLIQQGVVEYANSEKTEVKQTKVEHKKSKRNEK